MELTPNEHVTVQTTIQRWIDSSISKTVNAPKGYTVNQVAEVYEKLYQGGAKGGTAYVDGSRDTQVLTSGTEESAQEEILEENTEEEVIYGSNLGDTCPLCRKGIVEEIGGCHTCSNCLAHLQCGL